MYRIRSARADEIATVQDIEIVAARLFDGTRLLDGHNTDPYPAAALRAGQREERLWIAVDGADLPVAFALVEELDGCAHLAEIDVHPDHGRRGIGSQLLTHVCAWAVVHGYAAVTLTTFRDVPWNAPFYAKHGFKIVPAAALSPVQRSVVEREAAAGLRPEARVFMRRAL